MLTLISAIDLWLVDKSWRVHPVAAQKHVGWVRIASSNVASNVVLTSTVVAIKAIVAAVSTAKYS